MRVILVRLLPTLEGFHVVLRIPIVLLFGTGVALGATTPTFEELTVEAEEAQLQYDLQKAESLMDELRAYVSQHPNVESRMALARAALLVAELRRMEYETTDLAPRPKRLLGRTIDAAAKIGHDVLDDLPDVSEKWRITADLYGTMIRSKYKGNKYSGEMDRATERALELDPQNPNAIVTGCKRALFAKPSQGGDVPKAIETLNRALEIDPDHERALIFRGIAYDKLGQKDLAAQDWQRALEMNPFSRLARTQLEELVFIK